jgi:hypothetical protein
MLFRNFEPDAHKIDRLFMKKFLGAPGDFNDNSLMKQALMKACNEHMTLLDEKEKTLNFMTFA